MKSRFRQRPRPGGSAPTRPTGKATHTSRSNARVGWIWFAVGALVLSAVWLLAPRLDNRRPAPPVPSATNTVAGAPQPSPARPGEGTPPAAASPQERGVALLNQGTELLKQGRVDDAVRCYQEAVALMPEDEDAHYNLGIALARRGDLDAAIAAYETALRLFPDYAEVHNNLGNVLAQKGKTDEAIVHYRAAIEALPDYAAAHNNLGTALRRQGKDDEALRCFSRAVELDTNYWQARFNLGNMYAQRRRLDEATIEYREVLRLQPDFTPAKEALERLQGAAARPE